jgi:hypothetical protein
MTRALSSCYGKVYYTVKGESMKRLAFVFFATIIAFIFISPLQSEEQGPLFVEETNIPDGKALIYIYQTPPFLLQEKSPLVLAKEGPVGVLPWELFA